MADGLDKQSLEFLINTGKKLTDIKTHDIGGRLYSRSELTEVRTPVVTPLEISTLRSLGDLCTADFVIEREQPANAESKTLHTTTGKFAFERFHPKEHVIHVVNPAQVQVVTARSSEWAVREVLINCKLSEVNGFRPGEWMTQDQFIIAVLSSFVAAEDRAYVAKIAGNLMAENISTLIDDGVTQSAATRMGATMAERTDVKNIVRLAPYRTFREVAQPVSDYLFRLHQDNTRADKPVPKCALFEADGGKWKIEAVDNIGRYLRTVVPNAVVAC